MEYRYGKNRYSIFFPGESVTSVHFPCSCSVVSSLIVIGGFRYSSFVMFNADGSVPLLDVFHTSDSEIDVRARQVGGLVAGLSAERTMPEESMSVSVCPLKEGSFYRQRMDTFVIRQNGGIAHEKIVGACFLWGTCFFLADWSGPGRGTGSEGSAGWSGGH